MKRIAPLTVAVTIAGLCCVVAAYFCQFYYTRYQSNVTVLERQVLSFDSRLTALEAHKSRELTPVRIWGVISSGDRPPDERLRHYLSSEPQPDGFYEAINAKAGPVVRPELRLTADGKACAFDVQVEKQFGIVADAWLSHALPCEDLAAFEDLRVYSPNRTNAVRVVARLKPGASVQMVFQMVVLCEQ